ncbi:NLR family CARD domain-containing protein 3-like isoform X2 [Triplophysa dalaica]|nr:NLR family CARD domain-containing protein 3-like isoform X2 [Triplophysa dalaica]
MSVSEDIEEMEDDIAATPVSSCVSMRSNRSVVMSSEFTDETVTSDRSMQRDVLTQSSCGVCEQVLTDPVSITCGHLFCRHCIICFWNQCRTSEDFNCPQCRKRFRTRPVLQSHKVKKGSSIAHLWTESDMTEETEDVQQDCHNESVDDVLQRVKDKHKSIMKSKYENLFEGIKAQENQTLLKRIYTQLYIIEGESEGVNEEHEVLHMETKPRRTQDLQDTPIYCNDIFKAQSHQRDKIKSVLTKGIAGIGKTVSVHKFILDWAEGTANQDVDFMFLLPFRELNLIREHRYSLHKLLLDFHPELQDVDSKIYEECKVVFIFDGLDESRMTVMFSDTEKVSDVTDTSSVAVLMSNLMKGDLLPSALIWITSRPAAANQIPSKYITLVTEIQGFNDAQKEEYFRKRISDEHQASRIMSHIRRARSLHIMCHIPVFCWISSTVLQKILTQDHSEEIPKTLSEMYIHFLMIQMKIKNEKYDPERDPEINREVIVKLAEVAFKQLMKGNVMFYEEDLRECGIDITDASLYSGICTEIFKEESVIRQRKIYSFIHLSLQEFLAAFYVFCYYNKQETSQFLDVIDTLLKGAVDKALESETGHLDLFLRFLLGISLESNQRLLQDLLTHTLDTSQTIKKTTQYIKDQIKGNDGLSAERSINLFLCLSEVNDQTLNREIEEFVRSDKHSEKKLSAAHCSAIVYMLQMSEEVMDEFDLKKYNTTQEGRRRLIPAVNNCTRALLVGSKLTHQCCEIITSALQSSKSLRELDLSHNDLQDSGVKLISDALKNPNCQLQILRLSGCMVTDVGCCYLASALSSNPSHLRELDLSYNHPQHSTLQLLAYQDDPNYTLNKLNLDHGGQARITPGLRK